MIINHQAPARLIKTLCLWPPRHRRGTFVYSRLRCNWLKMTHHFLRGISQPAGYRLCWTLFAPLMSPAPGVLPYGHFYRVFALPQKKPPLTAEPQETRVCGSNAFACVHFPHMSRSPFTTERWLKLCSKQSSSLLRWLLRHSIMPIPFFLSFSLPYTCCALSGCFD